MKGRRGGGFEDYLLVVARVRVVPLVWAEPGGGPMHQCQDDRVFLGRFMAVSGLVGYFHSVESTQSNIEQC